MQSAFHLLSQVLQLYHCSYVALSSHLTTGSAITHLASPNADKVIPQKVTVRRGDTHIMQAGCESIIRLSWTIREKREGFFLALPSCKEIAHQSRNAAEILVAAGQQCPQNTPPMARFWWRCVVNDN
ncbi:hypothetical protein PoB_004429400 [Plakobranchus ocellatus]|uniref:Secreted protein n=1 Tax=Plakobranchus ocellatus TaxID=259542 RepID=A0AAV4BHH7_9GAST|nr:hypothetical protein PoB_004429400 [Plakobranchus ocellatus]